MEIRITNLDTPDVTRTRAASCAGTLTRVCGILEIEADGVWVPYHVAVHELETAERYADGAPMGYAEIALMRDDVVILSASLRRGVETFIRRAHVVEVSERNEHDADVAQFLLDLRDEILASVDDLPIAA